MSVTKKEIGKWLIEAKESGAKYVIISCDGFDFTDFSIECYGKKDLHDTIERLNANGERIMEIYDLSLSIKKQLDKKRAWNV